MAKKVGIIGSGFSSLSAACHLSKLGYEVHIFEKNESPGGRARQLRASGYSFDMGPSWYWMSDVFEHVWISSQIVENPPTRSRSDGSYGARQFGPNTNKTLSLPLPLRALTATHRPSPLLAVSRRPRRG